MMHNIPAQILSSTLVVFLCQINADIDTRLEIYMTEICRTDELPSEGRIYYSTDRDEEQRNAVRFVE